MTEITAETNQVMVANDEFCQVLAGADFLVESVVWADDVAILVATFWSSRLGTYH